MAQFQIVNSDPRKWVDWEKLTVDAELLVIRESFNKGAYDEYFDKQDCTSKSFRSRLTALSYIWGG
jgi:hypothetical protein